MSCLGCDMIGSFPTHSQPSGGVFKTSCHMVCSFYFNQKYSVGFMWFNHMPTRMENHFCSITDHLQLMCWYSMQLLEMFKFAHSEVCTKAWTLLQHFWWCNAILMYQHRVRGWSFFCVLFHHQLAYLLSRFQYFVCPVGFNSETNGFTVECEPSDIFVMQEYTLPAVVQNTLRWVRLCPSSICNIRCYK